MEKNCYNKRPSREPTRPKCNVKKFRHVLLVAMWMNEWMNEKKEDTLSVNLTEKKTIWWLQFETTTTTVQLFTIMIMIDNDDDDDDDLFNQLIYSWFQFKKKKKFNSLWSTTMSGSFFSLDSTLHYTSSYEMEYEIEKKKWTRQGANY